MYIAYDPTKKSYIVLKGVGYYKCMYNTDVAPISKSTMLIVMLP